MFFFFHSNVSVDVAILPLIEIFNANNTITIIHLLKNYNAKFKVIQLYYLHKIHKTLSQKPTEQTKVMQNYI